MAEARTSPSGRRVDIAEVIDARPFGRYQLGLVALCALIILMDGFDAQAIGYVAPLLAKTLGVAPPQLAPVFSAGLLGIMVGSLTLGPLADYVGRRRLILWCTGLCGLFTLATVTVESLPQLLALRFATGVCIGGSFPNLIALTDEFAPKRHRASAVMLMICGISFGSVVGGFIAAQLSANYGWQAVFWIGGAIPLGILVIAIWRLPESIRFLARSPGREAAVVKLLSRVAPDYTPPPGAVFTGAAKSPGVTVIRLFQEGRTPRTLLIWTMFFMNLLNIFFMMSWLPTVLNTVGHPLALAVMVTALFQGAGIFGTLLVSRTEGRLPAPAVLATFYFIGGAFIMLIGLALSSPPLLLLTVGLAGFCIVGAQNASNALLAGLYPTDIRATGVGWAYGVGRIGSIVGPLIGGALLAMAWKPSNLFLAAGLPSLIAATASFSLYRLTRPRPATMADAVKSL